MQSGIYVALSSQVALERRLTTIADNVANANTVGFRATGVKFEDLMSGLGEKSVAFVSTGDTFLSQQSGGVRQTGNPLDFAVQGEGWFAIDTPIGQVMTRDGRFTLLENGDLVTLEGHAVLDPGGAAIQLDPQAGPPQASADGVLRQNGQLVAAIGLFTFQPGINFERYGNSGIVPVGEPEPLVDQNNAGILQGYVEDSNVNPVLEITRLIQVQRAFDQVSALIRSSESSLDRAIETLGSSRG